jgi:hypothetical protein
VKKNRKIIGDCVKAAENIDTLTDKPVGEDSGSGYGPTSQVPGAGGGKGSFGFISLPPFQPGLSSLHTVPGFSGE